MARNYGGWNGNDFTVWLTIMGVLWLIFLLHRLITGSW